jgi:hypothetical protein
VITLIDNSIRSQQSPITSPNEYTSSPQSPLSSDLSDLSPLLELGNEMEGNVNMNFDTKALQEIAASLQIPLGTNMVTKVCLYT